jgi:hypothetical protein
MNIPDAIETGIKAVAKDSLTIVFQAVFIANTLVPPTG